MPLIYACIRNVLVSQGLFTVNRRNITPLFFVNSEFENEVAKLCKAKVKRFTLEQLKIKLEANTAAGAMAEEYVLRYERKRICNQTLCNKIKLISEIDVCAGYDIISFESDLSDCYDRFIEVKAISKNNGFFWSRNEYEVAKLKGNQYYLYLVDLKKIHREEYVPFIIRNPAESIMKSQEWFVEPESYHICKV